MATKHNNKQTGRLSFFQVPANILAMETTDTAPRSRAGGWRGHPNSIATLHKYRVSLSSPALRRCVRCRQVAMRGIALCRVHDTRKRQDTPGRMARRVLAQMERRGLLPAELVNTPGWRDMAPVAWATRDRLRLALVLAWDSRDSEPLAWARAWRAAREAVRGV